MPEPPETAELAIESVGALGHGIGRWRGRKVFVPFTLPGERIEAVIAGEGPDGYVARAERWIAESPERAAPPCPHFGRCGGCALQHWSDAAYAAWKTDLLATALRRVGLSAELAPLRRTPPGARRRAGLVARFGAKGVRVGFRERASHRVIAIERCPVLRPALERLIAALPQALAGLAPAEAEWALDAGETLTGIDLLVTAPAVPDLAVREALAALAERLDLAKVSWRSGERGAPEPIAARRAPILRFAEVAVEPPPGAFFQASAEGEGALTQEVAQMTAGGRRIADLYAGIGTFTFPLAASGATVRAIEGDAAALSALAQAARRSRWAPRIEAVRRDLARAPLAGAELDGLDIVVLDPPRAGAKAQCATLANSKIPLIVVVSCNPATFARDARLLVDGGYHLERVVPVDQFLWSPHLELVALLRR